MGRKLPDCLKPFLYPRFMQELKELQNAAVNLGKASSGILKNIWKGPLVLALKAFEQVLDKALDELYATAALFTMKYTSFIPLDYISRYMSILGPFFSPGLLFSLISAHIIDKNHLIEKTEEIITVLDRIEDGFSKLAVAVGRLASYISTHEDLAKLRAIRETVIEAINSLERAKSLFDRQNLNMATYSAALSEELAAKRYILYALSLAYNIPLEDLLTVSEINPHQYRELIREHEKVSKRVSDKLNAHLNIVEKEVRSLPEYLKNMQPFAAAFEDIDNAISYFRNSRVAIPKAMEIAGFNLILSQIYKACKSFASLYMKYILKKLAEGEKFAIGIAENCLKAYLETTVNIFKDIYSATEVTPAIQGKITFAYTFTKSPSSAGLLLLAYTSLNPVSAMSMRITYDYYIFERITFERFAAVFQEIISTLTNVVTTAFNLLADIFSSDYESLAASLRRAQSNIARLKHEMEIYRDQLEFIVNARDEYMDTLRRLGVGTRILDKILSQNWIWTTAVVGVAGATITALECFGKLTPEAQAIVSKESAKLKVNMDQVANPMQIVSSLRKKVEAMLNMVDP